MLGILGDESGIEEFPFRLMLGSLLGIAALGFFLGFQHHLSSFSKIEFESRLAQLGNSLEHLYKTGISRDLSDRFSPPGSSLEFRLDIPLHSYLGIGIDPDPDNDGIICNTPPELISSQEQNALVYAHGGDKRRLIFDFKFREGFLEHGSWRYRAQGLVLVPGSYRIEFELVWDPDLHQKYLISRFNDSWDCWMEQEQS